MRDIALVGEQALTGAAPGLPVQIRADGDPLAAVVHRRVQAVRVGPLGHGDRTVARRRVRRDVVVPLVGMTDDRVLERADLAHAAGVGARSELVVGVPVVFLVGAAAVGILSPSMDAVFIPRGGREKSKEDRYSQVLSLMADCDLVIVEGDSQTDAPKIEVWRAELGTPSLARDDASILAISP